MDIPVITAFQCSLDTVNQGDWDRPSCFRVNQAFLQYPHFRYTVIPFHSSDNPITGRENGHVDVMNEWNVNVQLLEDPSFTSSVYSKLQVLTLLTLMLLRYISLTVPTWWLKCFWIKYQGCIIGGRAGQKLWKETIHISSHIFKSVEKISWPCSMSIVSSYNQYQ